MDRVNSIYLGAGPQLLAVGGSGRVEVEVLRKTLRPLAQICEWMEAIKAVEGECAWKHGTGQIKGFSLDRFSLRSLTWRTQLPVNAGVQFGSRVCSKGKDSSVLSFGCGSSCEEKEV